MLLTLTTTHKPATDLGYLLHKNPNTLHPISLSAGVAWVFYPEVSDERCTAALVVELDPIALIRGTAQGQKSAYPLDQYVNDKPYASTSFMSVAITKAFSSALKGRSRERQALAEQELPFEARISSLPCRGGERLLRRLFEPLGYTVTAEKLPLDTTFSDWGDSPYKKVTLKANKRLKDLLTHLNVLIPVLDNSKHYWIGDDEVDKLLRRGEGWLNAHPMVNEITHRYLKHRKSLARQALEQLVHEEAPELKTAEDQGQQREDSLEKGLNLNDTRLQVVANVLKDSGAKSVVDLGCGEGKLLSQLLKIKTFKKILGMDVSLRNLEIAEKKLNLKQMPTKSQERIDLIHGSLLYRDKRIEGFEAAAIVEVIEHMDLNRLEAFERVLFGFAKPKTAVVTTPNAEYNVKFTNLPAGTFRHSDHRFEWTRQTFKDWAEKTATQYGYEVEIQPIGPVDDILGAPTQMGVFHLCN